MNCFSKEVRAKKRYLREQNAKWPDTLIEVPAEQWPESFSLLRIHPAKVFRSKTFLVQVFQERPWLLRLSICRCDVADNGQISDGITWDELQRLKSECGFEDCDGLEVYPPSRDKVNVANMRHLWIFTNGSPLDFIWRKSFAPL